MSDGADGAGLTLVILAAGRARRYGGCKPLAPVGTHGEAVIDLVASDALAAGFGTIVLVLGPEHRPGHPLPRRAHLARRRRRALRHPAGALGTVDAVLCASDHVGDAPYGVGNADDVYGRDGVRPAGRAPAGHGDANALVGYRLADAVIGFVAGHPGHLPGGRRRAAPRGRRAAPGHGHAATAASSADDGREPAILSPRRPGVDEPLGLHRRLSQDAPGGHGRRHRRVRGVRGPPARSGRPVARPPARSASCPPRAAASGSPIPTTSRWCRPS